MIFKLKNLAEIRTGIVVARKKANAESENKIEYPLINLKCISENGKINLEATEKFEASELIAPEFLTKKGDILVRLSMPYTATIITEEKEQGYVIPSHFAIIRVDKTLAVPEYILWLLRSSRIQQQIRMNQSGSSGFGTISSGFFNNINVQLPAMEQQQLIGNLLALSEKEQSLLHRLALEKQKYTNAVLEKINNAEG